MLTMLGIFTACIGGWPSPSVVFAEYQSWRLVWQDEFDGPVIDTKKWEITNRKNSENREKQYYLPEQASIVNGSLRITATNQVLEGKPYRSARLSSKQAFPVGRFEARIDLPTSQGMWPAFWLLPRDQRWPLAGEIDIVENKGGQPTVVSSAYHWQTDPGPCCDQHQYVVHEYSAEQNNVPVNFHSGFHIYALEWEAAQLRFYVDGELHYTVDELPDRPIFETPMNIIFNLAVGGDFGGDPDSTTVFPQVMDIDYVRVWERAPLKQQPREVRRSRKAAAIRSPFGLRRRFERGFLALDAHAESKTLPILP